MKKALIGTFLMMGCLSFATYADKNGHGHHGNFEHKHGHKNFRDNDLDDAVRVPPGLAKQGKVPPGLAKQGKIPPGWSEGKNNEKHIEIPTVGNLVDEALSPKK